MKGKVIIFVLILMFCCALFACSNNTPPDTTQKTSISIVYKLKTTEYSFSYNSSTKDVIKNVKIGEKLGNNYLVLSNDAEIQNQEYKFLDWYYLDKDGKQKIVDKDTIIRAENLNINEEADELILYAKIKKLWL